MKVMNCLTLRGQSKSSDLNCGGMKNIKGNLVEYVTTDGGRAEARLIWLEYFGVLLWEATGRFQPLHSKLFRNFMEFLLDGHLIYRENGFMWRDSIGAERTEAIHG
jgi:hypothetical protein